MVAPGVFTRERDLSYLTQGIANIGAAFIGPMGMGPGFRPVVVDQTNFSDVFGPPSPESYASYAVRNYLRNGGTATVVRVMGLDGYKQTDVNPIALSLNGLARIDAYSTSSAGLSSTAVAHDTNYEVAVPLVNLKYFDQSLITSFIPSGTGGWTCLSGSTIISGSKIVFTVAGSTGTPTITSVIYSASAEDGTNVTVPFGILHSTRESAKLDPTAPGTQITSQLNPATGDFTLQLSSSLGTSSLVLNTYMDKSNYFASKLGRVPTSREFHAYAYSEFPRVMDYMYYSSVTPIDATIEVDVATMDFDGVGYSEAVTPIIQSKLVSGHKFDLFRVHTFNDGNHANEEVKISISDIDEAKGTFTLSVRSYFDPTVPTDREIDGKINQIEIFAGLSMDPTSTSFIGQQIGTSFVHVNDDGTVYIDGDFPARSKYIWIELIADVDSLPLNVVPWGFDLVAPPNILDNVVAPSYRMTTVSNTDPDQRYYYGFDFEDVTNRAFIAPLPLHADTYTFTPALASQLSASAFSLDDISDMAAIIAKPTSQQKKFLKFTVPFQGGFDGLNPARTVAMGVDISATNTMGFNLATSVTAGSVAYKRAIDAVSNPEAYDINLLVLPGVIQEFHPYITDYANATCENRGDCFYIMDLTGIDTGVDSAVQQTAGYDSNYAAVYFPWIKVFEPTNNKYIWVPPSVSMPEVYAYSDQRAAEWYAPAGLNRGGIPGAVGLRQRLTSANRDDLYEARINPIASFTNQGIVVWGQKTLQLRMSALDRVNVRRLLLTIKKFIASSARYLVFEQNVEATRQKFLNIANPYLASIQERSGLYSFKVVMDASNNTSDTIDRNMLVGQIYLQPTKTAEFISLEFNIMPTGAIFPTA